METMIEAAARLRAQGYVVDYTASDEGLVSCGSCGHIQAPEEMSIDEIVRYEGASDPGDEEILFALRCECGHKGLYQAAFGPDASIADVAVVRRLS